MLAATASSRALARSITCSNSKHSRATARNAVAFNATKLINTKHRVSLVSRPSTYRTAHRSSLKPVVAVATPSSNQPGGAPSTISSLWSGLAALANAATTLFPVFVVGAALLGLNKPAAFSWFENSMMSAALGVTMLGMGLTLTKEDIKRVFATPGRIFMGFSLQYTIMPLLGFLISKFAGLPLPYAIGLSLVACCPGGTASNVVTYIAKADMPLSVAMTAASTLGAVVMTPLLSSLIIGQLVPVDAMALLMSTLQVVLLPVALGYTLNQLFPKAVAALTPLSALSAVLLIATICGSVVAQNAAAISQAGPQLLAAIVALHAGGFFFGYLFSKVQGAPESVSRTNSIEVGMQNSALGALLAISHFPAHPLAAVPCAISACTHSVMGSLLAAYWRNHDPESVDAAAATAAASGEGASAAAQKASGVLGFWKLDVLENQGDDKRKQAVQKWIVDWRARIDAAKAGAAAKKAGAAGGKEDDLATRQEAVRQWIAEYKERSAAMAVGEEDEATRKAAAAKWIDDWRRRTGVNWM